MRIETKLFDAMDSITRVKVTETTKEPPKQTAQAAPETKQWEVLKDPPSTVLKFVNDRKEVEFQVPSEVQLKIYKEIQRFLQKS